MLCVFIEARAGKVKKSSLEALSEAGRAAAALGTEACAVTVGPEPGSAPPGPWLRGLSYSRQRRGRSPPPIIRGFPGPPWERKT